MFTGIVEELGTVVGVADLSGQAGDAARLTVRARTVLADTRPGDSVAVNGCCLTVSEVHSTDEDGVPSRWSADVMQQTLWQTSLAGAAAGTRVNLERAVRADQRLGGHMVQGHVDATGAVLRRDPGERWEIVEIALPAGLGAYVVDQGSVAVDGVSLTVVEVRSASFTVSLVPETLERTTLGLRAAGETVNLEVDVLAKYVERQVQRYAGGLLPTGSAPPGPEGSDR